MHITVDRNQTRANITGIIFTRIPDQDVYRDQVPGGRGKHEPHSVVMCCNETHYGSYLGISSSENTILFIVKFLLFP